VRPDDRLVMREVEQEHAEDGRGVGVRVLIHWLRVVLGRGPVRIAAVLVPGRVLVLDHGHTLILRGQGQGVVLYDQAGVGAGMISGIAGQEAELQLNKDGLKSIFHLYLLMFTFQLVRCM